MVLSYRLTSLGIEQIITLTLATVLATKYIFFDKVDSEERLKKRRVTIQEDKDGRKLAKGMKCFITSYIRSLHMWWEYKKS